MPSITYKIKEQIGKLVDKTTHLNVAETTEAIAKKFGLSERLVNYTHIELRNKMNEFGYRRIPLNERFLFLPHCLRNSKYCKASYTNEGLQCKRCGKCQINELIAMAEEVGFQQVFICPGGSMVKNIMMKYRPKAVLGVSCFDEATLAFDSVQGTSIAPQATLLLQDGCKDTRVNLTEVKEKMLLMNKGLLLEEKKD